MSIFIEKLLISSGLYPLLHPPSGSSPSFKALVRLPNSKPWVKTETEVAKGEIIVTQNSMVVSFSILL